MNDVNWNGPNARATALYLLSQAFQDDPMMQLFSESARIRLANYIIEKMADKNLNIYQAYNYITYEVLPRSPYSAFGDALAKQVGILVQQSLYAEKYAEHHTTGSA